MLFFEVPLRRSVVVTGAGERMMLDRWRDWNERHRYCVHVTEAKETTSVHK